MTAINKDDTRAARIEHRFRVTLHDTDAAGVLFFGHLFRHAHDAYEHWMRLLGHPIDMLIRHGLVGLPIAHADADYREPLRHGDEVRVRPGLVELWPDRFAIQYRFETDAGRLAATARTVHVCIDTRNGCPQALPYDLARTLKALPKHDPASFR